MSFLVLSILGQLIVLSIYVQMNGIKSLQGGVRNSLRSSIILFDLPRVVEELTFNSLDAGATKVMRLSPSI